MLKNKEDLGYGCIGFLLGFVVGLLFYDSCWIGIITGGIGVKLFHRYMKSQMRLRRKIRRMEQFKEAMESVVSAMIAGHSLEHAMEEAGEEMPEGEEMTEEFRQIARKIRLHAPADELLIDLGERTEIQEIQMFGEILVTAGKTGGNIVNIMRKTRMRLVEKMEMKREMETLVAGKKLESYVMSVIPFFMIVYLRVCSPGFLDPIYHNLAGGIVMTICLGVYCLAFAMAQNILRFDLDD